MEFGSVCKEKDTTNDFEWIVVLRDPRTMFMYIGRVEEGTVGLLTDEVVEVFYW